VCLNIEHVLTFFVIQTNFQYLIHDVVEATKTAHRSAGLELIIERLGILVSNIEKYLVAIKSLFLAAMTSAKFLCFTTVNDFLVCFIHR